MNERNAYPSNKSLEFPPENEQKSGISDRKRAREGGEGGGEGERVFHKRWNEKPSSENV